MLALLPIDSEDDLLPFDAPKGWDVRTFDAPTLPDYLGLSLSPIGYVVPDPAEGVRLALQTDDLGILTLGEHRFLGIVLDASSTISMSES